MKTAIDIERDFIDIINRSKLAKELKGGIYRKELRPINSDKEDLVISLLSGEDGQIQSGIVIASIYVPDVDYKGRYVIDMQRIGILEKLIHPITEDELSEYSISLHSTPHTIKIEGINQHMISIQFYYEYLNIND